MYSKLFSSITFSSLWCESKETRLLFVSMLAQADETGFVEASLPGLARIANLTQDETKEALDVLMSADPHSKNPANDGKRVVQMDGGYGLLNYETYREKRDAEARKKYQREYMREYRKRKQNVNNVDRGEPGLAQAEAEAEAEADTEAKKKIKSASADLVISGKPHNDAITVSEFFDRWNRFAAKTPKIKTARKLTPERKKKIQTRLAESEWFDDFREACRLLPIAGDGWQPDMDWMIRNAENVYLVLEGKYDWRGKDDPAQQQLTEKKRRNAAEAREAEEAKAKEQRRKDYQRQNETLINLRGVE